MDHPWLEEKLCFKSAAVFPVWNVTGFCKLSKEHSSNVIRVALICHASLSLVFITERDACLWFVAGEVTSRLRHDITDWCLFLMMCLSVTVYWWYMNSDKLDSHIFASLFSAKDVENTFLICNSHWHGPFTCINLMTGPYWCNWKGMCKWNNDCIPICSCMDWLHEQTRSSCSQTGAWVGWLASTCQRVWREPEAQGPSNRKFNAKFEQTGRFIVSASLTLHL